MQTQLLMTPLPKPLTVFIVLQASNYLSDINGLTMKLPGTCKFVHPFAHASPCLAINKYLVLYNKTLGAEGWGDR
jgi:hypothetical protein